MKNEFPRGELKCRRKGKWRAANKRVTRKIYRVTRTGMKGNLGFHRKPSLANQSKYKFMFFLQSTCY